jgi:hypothetical protein
MAPFGDVLTSLEDARQSAWAQRSPHNSGGHRGHRGSSVHGGLPNSHSQPIYVPGKYSVSRYSVSISFLKVIPKLKLTMKKKSFFVCFLLFLRSLIKKKSHFVAIKLSF